MPWNPFARKRERADVVDVEGLVRDRAANLGLKIVSIQGDDVSVEFRGEPAGLSLANLRPRVRSADPAERAAIVDFFLRASLESFEHGEEDDLETIRDRLMPRLTPPFAPTVQEVPPSFPLLKDLLLVHLVIDYPNTVSYVRQKHLDAWHARLEDLYPMALDNLRQRSSPTAWKVMPEMPGVLSYGTGDSYDATRALILGNLLDPWPMEGALLSLPTRDLLMCVRLDTLEALKHAQGMIGFGHFLYGQGGYEISDQLFWFDGKSWERVPITFEPNGTHVMVTERLTNALNRLKGA